MTAQTLLSTREVVAWVGVHPQTLRRWEREGVVPVATRRRGQRVYTADDLERIKAAVMRPAPEKEGKEA